MEGGEGLGLSPRKSINISTIFSVELILDLIYAKYKQNNNNKKFESSAHSVLFHRTLKKNY